MPSKQKPPITPETRAALRKISQAAAIVTNCIRTFESPDKLGGCPDTLENFGDDFRERVLRGDQTIIHDYAVAVRDKVDEALELLQAQGIGNGPPRPR